jgi:hypothetical protein
MNSSSTESFIMDHLSTSSTSKLFNPSDSVWINCTNLTYLPHSNECGPRRLLALSVLGTHPNPTKVILLHLMHPNLSQISWWWIAKNLITFNFDSSPLLQPNYATTFPPIKSLNADAIPTQLTSLISSSDRVTITSIPLQKMIKPIYLSHIIIGILYQDHQLPHLKTTTAKLLYYW